jgi:ABC-2 type transport system permease protein
MTTNDAVALMAAERIKMASTRSPWWCGASAVALAVWLTGVFTVASEGDTTEPAIFGGPFVLMFPLVIVMVMATVSVTTEYRFSTIRATFQAAPNRTAVLLAKAVVAAGVGAFVGLVAALASYLTSFLLQPLADLSFAAPERVRVMVGAVLVFAVASVLALAVGILVRQTAGAVSLLLVWALLVENLMAAIPNVGAAVQPWLPFTNALNTLSAHGPPEGAHVVFGPWGSLGYLGMVAAALLAVAIMVANRRDA